MAWYDDPAIYYAPADEDVALAQGDIVIAPTATFFPGGGEPDAVAPELGGSRIVRVWRGADDDRVVVAPTISADIMWALAMVVPHNCAMEKEWNERVVELKDAGASQNDAERGANADPNLDVSVTIAPILRYEGLQPKRERSIRSGMRLSAFPIVGDGPIPDGYVDLNSMTTVHYTLVPTAQRVAALSELAQAFLQKKLAMHFAYRDDSDLNVVSRAFDRRIIDVNLVESPSKKSRRVKVAMVLEDGHTLMLEGDAPSTSGRRAPERPARTTGRPRAR